MTALTALLLLAAILLTTAGQLLIKRGAMGLVAAVPLWRALPRSPWLLGGLACAVLAPLAYMLLLREMPLSVAFPAMSTTYILVAAGAALLFRERMSVGAWLGVVLVVAGLTLIGLAS